MRNLILLFACAVSSLYAQGTTSHFIKRPSFQTGIIFQHWSTAGNQELREIVMPLVIHYAVSERFSVSVLNTPARAEYQAPGVSSRLTAFTDTKLSLALVMNDERLLLNFGINIPSGQTKLDPATELPVAQQITTHALTMPMNYFGGGFDANASIAGAFETGQWILGGSLSVVYKGSYVPFAGAPEYRPGPEIGVAIGCDRPLGERNRIYGDLSYTWYGRDQSGGTDILQADGKINFSLAGIFANEAWQFSLLAHNRLKRQSPFALDTSLVVSYGNEFELTAELARPIGRNSSLLAVTDFRLFGKNADGIGAATIGGLGPGWRGALAQQLQMEVIARFLAGKMNDDNLWGIGVSLGFIWQF